MGLDNEILRVTEQLNLRGKEIGKMQGWRIGGDGSVWNLFQQRAQLDDDLKESLDEVNAVKKASVSARASILDMMQIKVVCLNLIELK